MLRPFLVISLVSASTAALAQPVPLTNADLKAIVSGALVEIDTPLGTKLPIRFGTDGLVSADAGELGPLLGSKKDRGRWWIDGDKLCSKWFRWFDAEVRCLTIARDGDRIHWRKDDGETGTATLVEAPKAAPAPEPTPTVVATAAAKADKTAQKSKLKPTKPKSKPPAPEQVAATTAPPAAPAPSAREEPEPVPAPMPQSPPVPTVVASVDAAPAAPPAAAPQIVTPPAVLSRAVGTEAPAAAESPYDIPMMRFGGTGLLEASARVAVAPQPAPIASAPAESAKEAPPPPRSGAEARAADKSRTGEKPRTSEQYRTAAHIGTPPPAARAAPPVPRKKPAAAAAAKDTSRPTLDGRPGPRIPTAERGALASAFAAPSSRYRVSGVARSDTLNVRRGPAETHLAIATIPSNGRGVEVTGACEGEWCPVRYGAIRGWVHSFYLAEESPRRDSSSPVYLARP